MNRKLDVQVITEMGCCIYTQITVSENYTMNEVVREIKRLEYVAFRIIETGMRFVYLNK